MQYCSLVRVFHKAFIPAYAPASPGLPGSMNEKFRVSRLQLITEEFTELNRDFAGGDLIGCLDALTDLEYVICGAIVGTGADRTGIAQNMPSYPQQGAGPPRLPHPDLFLQLSSDFLLVVAGLAGALTTNDWQTIAGQALLLRQRLAYLYAAFRVPEDLRLALFQEVHRSNMTKLGEDGKPIVNEAGRVVKGPKYEPPNIELVLHTHFPPAEAKMEIAQ